MTLLSRTAFVASALLTVACAAPGLPPPAHSSPLSTRAAEPPAPPVATSLTQDPLATGADDAPTDTDSHGGHHAH